MFCLFEKIKKCRMNLVKWSQGAFGNTRDRLNAKQQELQQLVNSNMELMWNALTRQGEKSTSSCIRKRFFGDNVPELYGSWLATKIPVFSINVRVIEDKKTMLKAWLIQMGGGKRRRIQWQRLSWTIIGLSSQHFPLLI